MKKVAALLITTAFLLLFTSCGEEAAISVPGNFTLTAAADEISVVLDWDPNPSEEEVDGYYIYFDGAVLDSTTNETYTHTDPQASGDYYVTAYAGEDESDPSTTLTTIPTVNTNVQIAEIGVPGEDSGFGWNISTGQGASYSMADASNAGSIDFYFTDWATGYGGTYEVDSPSRVPTDPGASHLVGTTGWKVTGFQALTVGFDNVTTLPTTNYVDFLQITINTTYGVYTEDGHYAMIEVQNIDQSTGHVDFRVAFQTVPGLAILAP